MALSASRRLGGGCQPPQGWRWAARAELEPLLTGRREPFSSYVSCFELPAEGAEGAREPEALEALCFLFADSLEAGGYLEGGCHEGELSTYRDPADLRRNMPYGYFGGIVCVRADADWPGAGGIAL